MRNWWKPLLLIAGLVAFGLVFREWQGGLDESLREAGARGELGFVILGGAVTAAGLPRQATAYAAAYAFGLWPGVALGLAAQMVGCALDLLWARAIARAWAQQLIEQALGGRVARLDRFVAAHPFSATLTLRLLPVGSNVLLNLLAGVSALPLPAFLAGTLLGYLPQTLVFALLGSGVRLDHGVQLGVGIGLFAVSAALGTWLVRRFRAFAPA